MLNFSQFIVKNSKSQKIGDKEIKEVLNLS
jgi:hypothetical protein